jgi:hypothetical protein
MVLIPINGSVWFVLLLKYPFATDYVMTSRWRDKVPSVIVTKGLKLHIHGLFPCRNTKSIMMRYWLSRKGSFGRIIADETIKELQGLNKVADTMTSALIGTDHSE